MKLNFYFPIMLINMLFKIYHKSQSDYILKEHNLQISRNIIVNFEIRNHFLFIYCHRLTISKLDLFQIEKLS